MSSLAQALKQRGHEISNEGKIVNILLPNIKDKTTLTAFKNILYSLMRKEFFLKNFRAWAYGEKTDEKQRARIESYITLCSTYDKKFDELEKRQDVRITKYAHTFEWYVSELMRREFSAHASGFNIRLKDADPDDEFDCVALIDSGIVFIECKTGKGEIYEEVKKFVRRDEELAATHSFFIFDRAYNLAKEGEMDLPNIKKSKADKLGLQSMSKISIKNIVFYRLDSGPRYFLATPAFKNLETRIRYMLRYMTFERDRVDVHKRYEHTQVKFSPD